MGNACCSDQNISKEQEHLMYDSTGKPINQGDNQAFLLGSQAKGKTFASKNNDQNLLLAYSSGER